MSGIDFVVTWVDGADPDWLKEKRKYQVNKEEDSRNLRYRDIDTLKYWFRSVEKYAPWVNMIHFVTWGHVPTWLNKDHSKINVVKHEEFIPHEFLPTFNSRVIELNLHRIEGLSEEFVYFNDDMFIIQETNPTDFFESGRPKDSLIFDVTSPFNDTFNYTLFNNLTVINKYFNKRELLKTNKSKIFNYKYGKYLLKNLLLLPWGMFTGFHNPHIPTPYLKSTFEYLWNLEGGVLTETCYHKFRNKNNVNHFLVRYMQLVNGSFKPTKILGNYLQLGSENQKVYNKILSTRNKMICINDSDVIDDFEKVKLELHSVFQKKFPNRSAFELI